MNTQLNSTKECSCAATRKKKMWQVLIDLFVVLVSIISLIPLLIVLFKSFFSFDELSKMTKFYPLPKEWTLENFKFIFTCDRLNIGKSMLWTFMVAIFGVVGSALVNTMAGYVFARMEFRGKNFFFACTVIQMFVPGMTTTLTSYMQVAEMGMLNTFWVLVIPGLASGGTVFFYRQFMLNMPSYLEEAALLDGCGRFQIYWRIFVPMCKGPMVVMGAGAFIGYWNAWLWPTMTVAQSDYMQVMQVIRSYETFYNRSSGYEYAAMAITFLVPLAVFLIFQKEITRGYVLSGLK